MIKLSVLSLMHVYFCSGLWSKWSVSCACIFLFSTTTYQIAYIVPQLQYNVSSWSIFLLSQRGTCILLFSSIIPTVWQLCLHIFVLNNKLPDHIYCYCVTVKCLILIKLIVLSVWPVYFCSQQLSKPSITCNFTLLMSPNTNISVLSHTFTVLKYL